MKKKILIGLTALAVVAVAALSLQEEALAANVFNNDGDKPITASECTTSSNSKNNKGACKERTDGLGDSCVTPGFWDSKNCNGQRDA